MGPLLFLLYINDLHKAITFSKIHHFTDDRNFLYESPSLKDINRKINCGMSIASNTLVKSKQNILECSKNRNNSISFMQNKNYQKAKFSNKWSKNENKNRRVVENEWKWVENTQTQRFDNFQQLPICIWSIKRRLTPSLYHIYLCLITIPITYTWGTEKTLLNVPLKNTSQYGTNSITSRSKFNWNDE